MSVPVVDAERAARVSAELSARALLQCRCGAPIAVVIAVEKCGRCRPPREEAEARRLEADASSQEPVEEELHAGVRRREPSADPEALARVAAQIAGALRREGPLNVRAIFKCVRVRRSHILDALAALEASGEATYTRGSRGALVWKVVEGGP
jgi:hypothetical protein